VDGDEVNAGGFANANLQRWMLGHWETFISVTGIVNPLQPEVA
jgi:hypothetical protein